MGDRAHAEPKTIREDSPPRPGTGACGRGTGPPLQRLHGHNSGAGKVLVLHAKPRQPCPISGIEVDAAASSVFAKRVEHSGARLTGPTRRTEEFRAADVANAGAAPRASEVIFEALVALQVGKGLSVDAARDAARARYPFLAAEADAALNADGAPQEASRKAHLASSLAAGGPEQHLSASAAHDKAAQAQDKVGDPDTAQIHRYMATFHRRQSKRLQPA